MIRLSLRKSALTLVLVPLLLGGLVACGSSDNNQDGDDQASGPCKYVEDGTEPAKKVKLPPSTPDPENPTQLTIATSQGDIPITLEPTTAPCAVNNFVSLAKQGYFDDTTCHRLSTEGYYVLQCGDPLGTGAGGPGYAFNDELVPNDPRLQPCEGTAYCTYNAGVIAMANRDVNTNGSQFFLVYGNSSFPPAYTVLGHMGAAGLKAVKAIGADGIGTPNGMGPGDGAPKSPVTITSVK